MGKDLIENPKFCKGFLEGWENKYLLYFFFIIAFFLFINLLCMYVCM